MLDDAVLGARGRLVCNPVDLAYRYQEVVPDGDPDARVVFREGADPSVVLHRGRYFMFVSMSRGFWYSDDLVDWHFRATEKLPAFDYAPDVRAIGDELYISASRKGEPCPFFRSRDPLADDFEQVTAGSFDFWDPSLFPDHDGALYLYWGCSAETPIYGVQLDPKTLGPVGAAAALIVSDTSRRGWERAGESYRPLQRIFDGKDVTEAIGDAPYLEGAWMTKHDGTYYLQYSAPGTEFNTYADGYVTATSPLGPFEYASSSPFSSKPGGFITGAGHGSTFQDAYGNWWHVATMRISVAHPFERRIGLFPAGFDEEGVLFCNQNFADYPRRIPTGAIDPWDRIAPEWMLLSLNASATASSQHDAHPARLATDEDVRTWWIASTAEQGEWITVDLGALKRVEAVQVNLADPDVAAFAPRRTDGARWRSNYRSIDPAEHATEIVIEISGDGEEWQVVSDTRSARADQPHALVVLEEAVMARFVRCTAGELPYGAPFAVSGIRVFGLGEGPLPALPAVSARRDDARTAELRWDPVPGAQGYNVRYGTHPEKLYSSWHLHGDTTLQLGSLNAGTPYWVAVDSFSEAGVSIATATLRV
ncbi:family 43 glycosylhydrolase [Mycetocola zhujimingii]|uniref:family 43 glycosylhydrolase n=1 Tax=Mycetocola zhujimingii TaxID=2079792 RepID=UPI0018E0AAC4|nr:family 43 glycosylhydrolase [Mycetocola zhujimingii]